MTCDDAFEALTDPTCREGDTLERHLAGCPRCRQMQEVLQPALALLAPSELIEERFDAGVGSPPAPFLTEELLAETERAARVLTGRGQQPSSSGKRPRASRLQAAAAVLFAVSALCVLSFFAPTRPAVAVTPGDASACLWKDRTDAVGRTEATSQSDRGETPSRQVVLTCMACHLPSTTSRP